MQVGELWAKLTLSDKDFHKNLKNANKGFSSFVDSITSNALTIGTVIGGIATGAVAQLGIEFNASMEQAKMGFTTMLGSAEKAEAFLKDLADFAKNTPFDFPGLRDAAKKMIAFGFESKQVVPILTSVGDAVAAVGGGQEVVDRILLSMGQMKATGRATWEEVKQLGENGIPALKILADAFGKTEASMMKMLSDGAVPADKAIQILTDGMNKRYGGMMKNMETTWNGMVSNIKDGAQFLIGSAFQPIFTFLRDKVLPKVKDTVAALQQNFDSGGGLAGALKILIPPGLTDDLKNVSDFIGDLKTKLQNNDWEGAGKVLGNGLKTMVDGIVGLGQKLADKVIAEAKSVNWAQVGKSSTEFALNFVLGFIGGLLDPAVWFAVVKENWDVILEIVLGVIFAPAGWMTKIASFLAKIPFVGKILEQIMKWLIELGTKVKAPVFQLFKDMGKFFMDGLDEGLKIGPSKIIATVKKIADDAVNALKDFGLKWFDKGGTWMKELGRGIGEKITSIVQAGRNIVDGLFQGIAEKGGWLYGKIKSFVNDYVVQPVKTFLGIQSPSKVMAEFGRYTAEGFALGMAENQKLVAEQGEKLASAVKEKTKAAKDAAILEAKEMSSQIKTEWQIMAEAIQSGFDRIKESVSLATDLSKAKFELWMATMGQTATESQKLGQQVSLLKDQIKQQEQIVAVANEAYWQFKKAHQENTEEGKKAELQWINERTALANLNTQLTDATKGVGGLTSAFNAAKTAADYLWEAAQRAWDAGNTAQATSYMNAAISGDNGLSQVGTDAYRLANPDMPDWLGGGRDTSVPAFHDGGTFKARIPGGEGLALLKDGEKVSAGQQEGGLTIVLNGDIYGMNDFESKVVGAMQRYGKKQRLAYQGG